MRSPGLRYQSRRRHRWFGPLSEPVPIVLVGSYFHFGVSLYWVLLANAATYASVGWIVEGLRQQLGAVS